MSVSFPPYFGHEGDISLKPLFFTRVNKAVKEHCTFPGYTRGAACVRHSYVKE